MLRTARQYFLPNPRKDTCNRVGEALPDLRSGARKARQIILWNRLFPFPACLAKTVHRLPFTILRLLRILRILRFLRFLFTAFLAFPACLAKTVYRLPLTVYHSPFTILRFLRLLRLLRFLRFDLLLNCLPFTVYELTNSPIL